MEHLICGIKLLIGFLCCSQGWPNIKRVLIRFAIGKAFIFQVSSKIFSLYCGTKQSNKSLKFCLQFHWNEQTFAHELFMHCIIHVRSNSAIYTVAHANSTRPMPLNLFTSWKGMINCVCTSVVAVNFRTWWCNEECLSTLMNKLFVGFVPEHTARTLTCHV